MKKAKEATVDFDRLTYAMQRSRWVLRYFRETRREMVRQYVGFHWSEEGAYKQVPVNLLALYVSIVGRGLIAKQPRVMLSTFDKSQKPAVNAMESWVNQQIGRMNLAGTLQRVVLDALFSIGVCKVALATPADSATAGWNLRAGMPFAERVDLDDFVFDVHARDFSECSFIGHRYRAPLEVVRNSKLYSKARLDLTASDDSFYNLEGDERISVLGRGFYAGGGQDEEFEDMVDLWEIYLPRHRLIVTLQDDNLAAAVSGNNKEFNGIKNFTGGALRVQKWLGPETGPYHILSYATVPGNAMPKAPLQDLYDLHMVTNESYRKLERQSARLKKNVLVSKGAMDGDGQRLMSANDGDMVGVDDPNNFKEVVQGGPDQTLLLIAQHYKDLYDFMAGGLSLLGGLAPQSKTLGQDKMLNQNASGQVSDMQDTTVEFVSKTVSALCWYWWHDPFQTMQVKHSLPGMPEMSINRKVTPQMRQRGRFEDLDVEVDPYSLQRQTPQQRVQALTQLVQNLITPMMPLLQQQGVAFDINTFLQKISKYMDMPDLAEIVTMQEPPQQQAGEGGPPSAPQTTTPNQTSREYVRRSVGAGTQANNQAQMTNMMKAGEANRNGSRQ